MKTIALVGCGRISRRHIEAIQATEGVEIAAVCDILPERARKCAEELSVPWTTDFRKLPPVDFAAVLTPSGNHPEHAAAIAESTGVGGILCEKPISLTMREAYHLFSRIDRETAAADLPESLQSIGYPAERAGRQRPARKTLPVYLQCVVEQR